MANRYANLPGAAKIKDTYDRINQGFDLVEQDVDQLRADLDQEIADREAAVEYVDQRVDNIIVGGGPDKDPELVDIRNLDPSYTPQREINVAGDVTRDMQAQFMSHKAETVTASVKTVDYYVSPTGDDSNPGTSDSPFLTLSKAVSMIPDVIRRDHIYNIYLFEGDWGSEELNLEHIIIYGKLVVQGTSEVRENHKVYRVTGESLIGHVIIKNITTTVKTANGQSFRFRRCAPYVEVINAKAESDPSIEKGADGVIGLLADYGSQVFVKNFECSGKRYAIRSNYLSRIYSIDNTGSDNTFGVGARWGGIVSIFGTQPTGDFNLSADSGGIVAKAKGATLGTDIQDILVETVGGSKSLKRFFLNSLTTGISSISNTQQLRVRFKREMDGIHHFNIKYGGQTSSTSGQALSVSYLSFINIDRMNPTQRTVIQNLNFQDDTTSLIMEHTGANGEFDLIIRPSLSALADRWGVDIEVEIIRGGEAPDIVEVSLEDR